MTDVEQRMWDLLRTRADGRAAAISQRDLAEYLETDTRRVQQITKALRDEFVLPVCASSRTVRDEFGDVVAPPGVYIPRTLDEAQESVANMMSRGWETIRSGRLLRAAVLRFCGPQRPLLLTGGDTAESACTHQPAVGEQSLCLWCGDVFTVRQPEQEFCQTREPLCRDRFWAEARRRGAIELRQELRGGSDGLRRAS